jgi:hypothetical protein
MDHRAAARAHIEAMEFRIAEQRRSIEMLDSNHEEHQDSHNRLALLEKALLAMKSEIARLLPTEMDAIRPNYRAPNQQQRRRGRPHRPTTARKAVAKTVE